MDLLNNIFFIKKSKHINCKKIKDGLLIKNNSNQQQTIIIPKINYFNNNCIKIDFYGEIISGELEPILKLVNRKREIISEVNFNSKTFLNKTSRFFIFALRIMPNSKVLITKLNFCYTSSVNQDINNYFKGNILLISPGYPTQRK